MFKSVRGLIALAAVAAIEGLLAGPALSQGGARGNVQFNNNGTFGGQGGTFYAGAFGTVHNGSTDDTAAIQAAINAAETLPSCGTVILGPFTYRINGTLTMNQGCVLQGTGTAMWGAAVGTVLQSNSSSDTLLMDHGASIGTVGFAIRDVTFLSTSGFTHTQKFIHLRNIMRFRLDDIGCSGGAWCIYMESPVGGDISDFEIRGPEIRDTTIGIECNAADSNGCGGNVRGGEIAVKSGGVGVKCTNGSQMGVFGVHFDGDLAVGTTGVYDACSNVRIEGNSFEVPSPAIQVDNSSGGNFGRGAMIVGNMVNVRISPNPITTVTCNTMNGSASLTNCSSIANVGVGDELHGSGVPDYSLTAPNEIGGSTYVASAPSGSTIPMTEQATATASGLTITVRAPVYRWPHSMSHPVVAVGNTYIDVPPGVLKDGQ